jgi:hypothetical protein
MNNITVSSFLEQVYTIYSLCNYSIEEFLHILLSYKALFTNFEHVEHALVSFLQIIKKC